MPRVSRPRRFLIVAVAAFASAAFAPVAADAAAPLGSPLTIDRAVDPSFDEPSASALAAGAADNGDALAAWRGSGSLNGAVKLALWRAGAPRPQIVDGGLGSDPDAAMSPAGHALAAWTGSDGRLRIAYRQPGAGFAAPTAIGAPAPDPFSTSRWGTPAVALRPDGSGTVAVPVCLSFGGSKELELRIFDVTAGGAVVFDDDRQPQSGWSLMASCPAQIGVARAAAGAGGRAAATLCLTGVTVCFLAIRDGATAPWTDDGVDGTQYGSGATAAAPLVAANGRVIVSWRAADTLFMSVGSDADAMSFPDTVASGVNAAPELVPLGADALALTQVRLGDGSAQTIERPLFSTGALGDIASIAGPSYQASPPYADPHGATWSDGNGLIALAGQPRGAAPALTLLRRSLGGTLTPLDVGPQTRAVMLPRVAVAGTPAQPLGLVATREAPAGGGGAAIVLRRIDGVPPRIALQVPPTAVAGTPLRLVADVADTSGAVTVGWSFGDGTTAQGAAVDHIFAAPGTRTVVVTATDALGNAASATATVQVAPAGGPGPGPGGPGPGAGAGPDRVKPALSRVRLSATRFRASRANIALAAARRRRRVSTPSGTSLRFDLSEAATVRVAVVRVRSGRTQRGRCRAGARRGRRCTIRTTAKTFTRRLAAGAATIPFSARFGGRALPAGGYELQLVATDAAGNRGAVRAVSFTLVR